MGATIRQKDGRFKPSRLYHVRPRPQPHPHPPARQPVSPAWMAAGTPPSGLTRPLCSTGQRMSSLCSKHRTVPVALKTCGSGSTGLPGARHTSPCSPRPPHWLEGSALSVPRTPWPLVAAQEELRVVEAGIRGPDICSNSLEEPWGRTLAGPER